MSEPRRREMEMSVAVYRLGEEPPEREYWLTRTPAERLAAVELLRRHYHGWTDDALPDFRDFFASFAAHRVRYLLVGGYALAAHGHPRYTGDIDAWVEPTPDNSERVVASLHAFGFASLGLAPDTFAAPNVIVQLGRTPLRIDILTSPSGVEFESCYTQRMEVNVDGLVLDVIGLDCLRVNKRASGRLQHLADLEALGEG